METIKTLLIMATLGLMLYFVYSYKPVFIPSANTTHYSYINITCESGKFYRYGAEMTASDWLERVKSVKTGDNCMITDAR